MESLYDLTKHESGAILYPDGTIFVGSWAAFDGIPIQFADGFWVSWYPIRHARRCATPHVVKTAMNEHEREQGALPSRTGFRSWLVNGEYVVTVQELWA